ncbi:uncharacterized protein LOC5506209 [Nematostella vectensis]|uniref:uncharacterized protein LOC5506209 n=1 Tax=Nematostella vectensis TaxID=45351 RepID=UPI0020777565|nr:uncharacterized protein LOC5506209 [Nematostella vectensis]
MAPPFQRQLRQARQALQETCRERETLRNLDIFVLDNTLRETTVGQLRGHTIDNKWAIYDQVKKIGFEHMIVASFNHMTRLGDTFIKQLHERGEDMTLKYAFTEFLEKIDENRVPIPDLIPVGMRKMKELGIGNAIIEIDLVYNGIDYKKFTINKICDLLLERFRWIRANLNSKDPKIFVNLRDFFDAINKRPRRILKVVNYLSTLPPEDRPFGIVYEESGKNFPETVGVWTRVIRDEMDRCGFQDGHLLVHVHEQWGMQDVTQLRCLANGANGIWAGLSKEGASMGHACSSVTLMNLVRMGNKKVLKKFNCEELRNAAIAVTRIVTGRDPDPLQPIYGSRALDMVFGIDQFAPDSKEFSMAAFFGEEPVMRITTLASAAMIALRLKRLFGEDPQFTEGQGERMKEVMLKDLHANIKEEYHSGPGLAMLFDRSGGKLTPKMSEVIANAEIKDVHIKELINEIRAMWDEWDLREGGERDDCLEFASFYSGFMAPYFGCYRCDETKMALKCIDMDKDDKVDWNEFVTYLKWAGHQYPQVENAEQLLSTAFRKGLIPAMQDEVIKQKLNDLPKLEGGEMDDDDDDIYD